MLCPYTNCRRSEVGAQHAVPLHPPPSGRELPLSFGEGAGGGRGGGGGGRGARPPRPAAASPPPPPGNGPVGRASLPARRAASTTRRGASRGAPTSSTVRQQAPPLRLPF